MTLTVFVRILKGLSLTTSLFFFSSSAKAQKTLYAYQDLSGSAYAMQRDSLKKAWTCPALYKEKATQKKYKELWDSRTNFITSAIDNQNYVVEKEIHGFLAGIINDLARANPTIITQKPLLLIDRSSAVNAYAIGNNLIAVNLGLIYFAQSREEVALVLAHELSHNILNHPENSMKEQAEWVTSKEYEASLKEVLDSKYERYSRLKKVFETYSLSNSRHHRYHESDADSLAIVLLTNAKIGFDAKFFLRLDSADMQYKMPLQKPVNEYFAGYGLAFDNAWMTKRTKGLSTRSYNFENGNPLDDSLKTHPDCSIRYATTLKFTTEGLRLTAIPSSIKEKTSKIIIWNLFNKLNLTASLYRILQEKDNGVNDEWYDFMLSNVISGLYHSDKTLRRFNAIGIVPKEYIAKSYYELQTALEQMPREKLEQFYATMQGQAFWKRAADDARAFQSLLATVIASTEGEEKELKKSAQAFMSTYRASMYCEFADHFTGN